MSKVTLPDFSLLNTEDLEVLRVISHERRVRDRLAGIVDRRVAAGNRAREIDLTGFGAEYAAAKFLGVEPDLSTEPRSGGVDLTLKSGQTVDVKGTRHKHGRLICTVEKDRLDEHADLALFREQPQEAKYELVGWVRMGVLLDPKNIQPFGPEDTPTHVVERYLLNRSVYLDSTPWKDDAPSEKYGWGRDVLDDL